MVIQSERSDGQRLEMSLHCFVSTLMGGLQFALPIGYEASKRRNLRVTYLSRKLRVGYAKREITCFYFLFNYQPLCVTIGANTQETLERQGGFQNSTREFWKFGYWYMQIFNL